MTSAKEEKKYQRREVLGMRMVLEFLSRVSGNTGNKGIFGFST